MGTHETRVREIRQEKGLPIPQKKDSEYKVSDEQLSIRCLTPLSLFLYFLCRTSEEKELGSLLNVKMVDSSQYHRKPANNSREQKTHIH